MLRKKVLVEADSVIETIVIDVTEHEVERPKKTEAFLQWQTQKAYT